MQSEFFRRAAATLLLSAAVLPLTAQPGQPVSVRVEGIIGEDRIALPQIPVMLLQRRPSMNLPFPLPRRSEVTGRDGWAHFQDVQPGTYSIYVRPVPPRSGKEQWMPLYAGGASTWRAAEAFTVRADGAPLEYSVLLKRAKPVQLTGKVINEGGRPAAGATVTLAREDLPLPPVSSATTKDDGTFNFGFVYPDAYRVRGEWQGQTSDEPLPVGVEGAPAFTLRLESTFPLEGRVVGQDLEKVLPKISGLRVHALPETGAILNEATAPVSADGSFMLPALAPGRYLLQPSMEPQGFYLSRVKLAGVDVLGEPVELHRGYGPLEVEFEKGPGSLTGVVEKGEAGGGQVAVVSADRKRRNFLLFVRSAAVDEKGRFQITNLAPGEYYVWAFDRLEARELSDEMLVERLKQMGETVKIVGNQASSVNLKLLSWDIAAGT